MDKLRKIIKFIWLVIGLLVSLMILSGLILAPIAMFVFD